MIHTISKPSPEKRERGARIKSPTKAERAAEGDLKIDVPRSVSDPDFPLIEDAYTISTPAKRWFVVLVRGGSAPSRLRDFAKRHGHQTYWPRAIKARKIGKGKNARLKSVARPLMPRYVLIHLPSQNTPFGIFTGHEGQFHGVAGFLSAPHGPLSISDAWVQSIRERERRGEFDGTFRRRRKVFPKMPEWVVPGEYARITQGPLASLHALIESVTDRGKVRTLVSIFGRETPWEASIDALAPV